MPKDLRTLLEPAKNSGKAGEAAPLAHRRALSSPGEPRVFRVRAGYVCGLCGRLHEKLDNAFDCLGRCTIELRLRTPAGRQMSGHTGHFACTACGRGYANTDDAEECFERCLARMKPSAQFEQALRRVQVRYVQRLQAHGVRSLQRIDPFIEHTKMLNTLTQEQIAMGRPLAQPDPIPSQTTSVSSPMAAANAAVTEVNWTTAEISPVTAVKPTDTQDDLFSTPEAHIAQEFAADMPTAEEASLTADLQMDGDQDLTSSFASAEAGELNQVFAPAEQSDINQEFTTAAQAELDSDLSHNTQEGLDTESETLAAEMPDPEDANALLTANALSVLDKIAASANRKVAKPAAQQKPSVRPAQSKAPAANPQANLPDDTSALLLLNDTPLIPAGLSQDPLVDESVFTESSPTAMSLLKQPTFAQTEPSDAIESGSALSMLATSTPESTQRVSNRNTPVAQAKRDKDSFDFDMTMGESDLSSAFSEACEFAQVAEQPETNILAADVLALLQTSSTDGNLNQPNTQTKELQTKKIEVDPDLLDKLTSDDDPSGDTVYLRKADMKSYRRNNAKYTCSACSKEFFTKEQVEACFYSHPEEGSEEARVLIERIKKTSSKTAA